MVAIAESLPGRTMRFYCVTHKVGFDAQSNRAVVCLSGDHALAKGFPDDSFWEYCCDCQHIWLLNTAANEPASKECPACEREITRRYVCSSCQVISIESDEAGRRKIFSLSNGVPSPSCPGCLQQPTSVELDHDCPDFGASFNTSCSTCPFCDAVLEAPPDFPLNLSEYLSNLKSPPTSLRFDAKANALTVDANGAYLLLPRVPGKSAAGLIPNARRLESKRDYYDIFYELFNCDNPTEGEVVVLRPALVENRGSGWHIKETGLLDIKADKLPAPVETPATTWCGNCGTVGNVTQEFCGRCGIAFNSADRQDTDFIRPVLHGNQTENLYTPNFGSTRTISETRPAGGEMVDKPTVLAGGPSISVTVASPQTKILVGVIALAFLVMVIVAISLSLGGNTIEKQLDEALTKGDLFPPPARNAYDLYNELRSSRASEATLLRYRDKLVPLLISAPNQLLSDLPSVGGEEPTADQWQGATRSLNWAYQLRPEDKKLGAKAAYCEGRAEFVRDNRSEAALQSWTRAAALDKTWALPINGIGLIYQRREDHPTAKSYFLRAVSLEPNWAHPYQNLGNEYLHDRNYENARENFRKALERANDWARPHLRLGQIALLLRDYATAQSEFEAALSPSAKGLKGKDIDLAQQGLETSQRKLQANTMILSP